MQLPKVASTDLMEFINTIGFLPFFRNNIPGFSLEECVDWKYWFPGDNSKAGFINSEGFPDFANFNRQGLSKGTKQYMRKLQYKERNTI